MFGFLFFIPTIVFFVQAIVFPLAICKVEKIPKAVNLNIGNLNADDIRKLDNSKRNYLLKQVVFHFAMAIVVTVLISILFLVLGNSDNALLVLPCNLIGIVVGLSIVLHILKKANLLKKELL